MTPTTSAPIVYRPMASDEAAAASEVIARVFDQFVAPEYVPEGRAAFLSYIDPAAFGDRQDNEHFTLVAVAGQEIAGVIEIRSYAHISLLFVAAEYQRQGIAGELWHQALDICRDHNPDLAEVTVNSSPYAVPIYQRMGFRPAGPPQVVHGIGFLPMILQLA